MNRGMMICKVEVCESNGSYSFVKMGSTHSGWIPTTSLAFADLPGESLAEQIESVKKYSSQVFFKAHEKDF